MKHIIYILIYIGISFPIYSTDLETDPAFIEIKAKLDSAWKVFTKKNLLYIERKEPVLVMPENKINAPVALRETESDKLERMKKFGMKMKPALIYQFQKRWTVNDLLRVDTEREDTLSKIQSLPKRYKIEHLLDKDLSRKGGEIYTPQTKKEKRKVKNYFNEKAKLEKKIPALPDYHLTKFSLFLISKRGVSSEYAEVYPESVMGEFIQVEKLLFKYKAK
jgi:hypothetical protein